MLQTTAISTARWRATIIALATAFVVVLVLPSSASPRASVVAAVPKHSVTVTGTKHFVVLRVYFHDYPATSRYSKAQVQGFFNLLSTHWGTNSSYGNIAITSEVSDLFQLPSNRSAYIDDFPDGDLSNGGKYQKVLDDAVANAPAGINWSHVDGVVVVMAETDPSQFHRGQGNKCNLHMGPGSSTIKLVGCAIFSENPSDTDVKVWGRWAHEMGHAIQAGGPAHPSNYNNEFEQMDNCLPCQTGVFEKQSTTAFGWMPDSKYVQVTPADGGISRDVYAEEYSPASLPNAQAIKAYITGVGSAYYLISVRRRVLGDDLNDSYSPAGLPDEGVLIERVTENGDPWVTVEGKGGDRDKLWQEGDTYTNPSDGIYIAVSKKFDADHYLISVRYSGNANKPDVGINSWLQPPSNTYETTDIWVDSPVNGYGTFRYGTWSDLFGGTVPRGNGDDPAIGQVNRLYARVRNYGDVTATNVKVHFDVTTPLGLGINGANGFVELGTVDSSSFPALASLAPGASADVYIDWTPTATLTPAQIAAGTFAFHSCVRVRIDHVAGETIFTNQDGVGTQENIDYFQAPPAGSPSPGALYKTVIRLRNDDKLHSKFFDLGYDRSKVPAGWKVVVNNNVFGVLLGPNAVRNIPVSIVPTVKIPLGATASIDVFAQSQRLLHSDINPTDTHPDFVTLGGVRVEGHAVAPTQLACKATRIGETVVFKGRLKAGAPGKLPTKPPARVLVEGAANGKFLTQRSALATVGPNGIFTATIRGVGFTQGICLFAGTSTLASATSGFVRVQ
jgi:hypothetical protein